MKKCIVGKNSEIIQNIAINLIGFDFYSHKDIYDINFKNYSDIYLFSWSHASQEENLKIIEAIPVEKIVFVSSVAVYSNEIKSQWNKYPKMKLEVENKILNGGGKIVRFGICDKNLLSRHEGFVPFTSSKEIINFLNQKTSSKITNLFSLEKGSIDPKSGLAIFSNFINSVADLLPPKFIFQGPLEILLKLMGSSNYGYTNNALRFFGDTLQIGYGAIGSHYWKEQILCKDNLLLVSPNDDILLETSGFRGLRIGKKHTGLSKFWHGVSVVEKDGIEKKKVPLMVSRPKLPNYTIFGEAKSFSISDEVCRVIVDSTVKDLEIFSHKLILAAGAIENCLIINRTLKKSVSLTDHEIGFIGTVDSKEIIEKKYLSNFGPFVYGRRIFSNHNEPAFMVDFRPLSNEGIKSRSNVYNDSASGIVIKLLSRFTFAQLNEAFFNKFGIGIMTKKLSVFVQLEVRDCITISPDCKLFRKRAETSLISKTVVLINKTFLSFVASKDPYLFDGIHVSGGKELLDDNLIRKNIANKKLTILSSPTGTALGPFHHTQSLIDKL